jgi:elongation factor 3
VAALSGGWKMKLALARAMLMKADIFLLDEPTNHLDTKNVAWIVEYLTHLPNVTSMIVSHDSGFLDNVCTDIIHYEGKKLRTYKGNLSEFVKVRPEAAAYYKLEAATQTFKLPEPGFLEGVKTKSKAILKMSKVGFTYPGTERKIISDVSIACSLLSRVAVIGPNGAGKSTMIKILTGELEPQDGMVWKHPNLRVAYVAQHAFHHIEQHLDKTPNEYIQWRYAIGEDRESLSKTHRQATEEEEKLMAKQHVIDGQKRVVEKILSRRKLKNSYEYEVRFVNGTPDDDVWMKRTELEDMGFTKLVNEIDMKEAARLGLHSKPLTKRGIEKHLEDVGIEPEVGSHTRMRGLSGGQKVKVVLAAAMWLNPHMLVLDEPTNYLDRESLGALAGAIREYGGGVVMISHNAEFTKELCGETWLMDAGKLSATGVPEYLTGQGDKVEWKREETMIDALGNEVKIKQPKKKLSRQELKKREKIRKAKLARGEEVSDSEDDE